jgi:hypothetical protein
VRKLGSFCTFSIITTTCKQCKQLEEFLLQQKNNYFTNIFFMITIHFLNLNSNIQRFHGDLNVKVKYPFVGSYITEESTSPGKQKKGESATVQPKSWNFQSYCMQFILCTGSIFKLTFLPEASSFIVTAWTRNVTSYTNGPK